MRKTLLLFILFFLPFLSKAQAAFSADSSSSAVPAVADSVVDLAEQFLGTPYKYGCNSPKKGFDCSGLTWYVFNHYGVNVPRSACEYAHLGKEVSVGECRKGDIILFRGTHPGDKRVGHVGIVISDPGQPLRFIHASSSSRHRGVVITEYDKSNYPKRFIKICRVIR